MTKLISGRVKKTPSANVSASRYEFIRLSETEPDLGLPAANGYVLSANVDGSRAWILPTANLSAISINALADVDTVTVAPSLGFGLIWNGTNWVPNVITVSSTELSNVANTVLGIVQSSLVANTAFFAANANFANIALTANVANTVLTLSNFTTANLAEGTNLYFTNARVYSNVIAALPTYTGNISAGNVIANTIITGSGGSITGANLISAGNISSTTWLNLYTANVIETAGNLYFTNARVQSNVIGFLPTLAGDNIIIAANGRISANLLGISVNTVVGNLTVTGNIIANSFISPTATSATLTSTGNLNITAAGAVNINSTNVIASGNVIANTFISTGPGSGLISSTGNVTVSATGIVTLSGGGGVVISGPLTANITTANVTELNNLYYTNARVRSALSGGTGVSYDNTTGGISIGQNVSTSSNVTFGGLNVTGPVNFYGNVTTHSSNNLSISDNMIYLNNGSPSANPDLGIAFNYNDGVYHNAGFFRDATDGTFKVFDNYDPAPDANIFINTAHASFRLANLSATTLFGNVQGTVSTLNNFTTSNLAEGTNKYFSNALARNALSAGDATIIYDPTTGTIRATANVTATIETTVNNLSTANVTEAAGNLYYTNARVYSNVLALLSTYTGNISAGNIIANTIITGTGSGGSFTGANLISAGNISATTWLNLYTANVVETSGNLYFTNARVVAALSAGSGIAISANGQISSTTTLNASSVVGLNTANVSESNSNLYYTNARVLSNVTAYLAANPPVGTFGAANVGAFLTTYTGNISAGNIIANTIISPTATSGTLNSTGNLNIIAQNNTINLTASNVLASGNVIANTFIATGSGAAILSSTSNILISATGIVTLSGSSIVVNGPLTANSYSGIVTANVVESASNLYFTNARVVAALSAGSGIALAANGQISSTATVTATSITGLNTANVNEFGGNLYYSNARVLSNVTAYLAANPVISTYGNANVGAFLTTYTGNISAGNVIANAIISGTGLGGSITGANLISANNISASVITANTIIGGGSGGSITGANLISTNNISAVTWTGLYTANVIETSGNLYFTNARVQSNVIGFLPSLAGDNISIAANGRISATTSATVNVLTIVGLTTANVTESNNNLYYTNARVVSNVIAYLAANPAISTYGNANVGAYLTTYTGNINAGNVIANSFISTAPGTGTLTATGDFNIVSGGNIRLTGNVYANTFISTATGAGSLTSTTDFNINAASNVSITAGNINLNSNNIITAGNVTVGKIAATIWQNLYTTNVIEFGNSIFYTNARVYSNVIAALPTYTGNIAAGNLILTGGITDSTGVLTITTTGNSNIELFAAGNGRILIDGMAFPATDGTNGQSLTTNGTGNLYWSSPAPSFSNANVGAYLTTYTGNINAGNITANAIIAGQGLGGSITGANLISANNISASVIFANTIVGGGSGGSITGANLITTNTISAINWTGLYTANVIETSGNLYFTNARVVSALSAGSGIAISANGQISSTTTLTATSVTGLNTANVNEFGSNLYYTNARVLSNVTAYLAANPAISTYGNANVGAFLTTYTGNVTAGNVIANSFISTAPGTGSLTATGDFNIVSGGNIRLTGNVYANTFISTATGSGSISSTSDFNINATTNVSITAANINLNSNNIVTTGNITAGRISSTTWQNLYTANVIETSGNLYFTNARVLSNVLALLPTLQGDNITIAANGRISATASATVNVLTIVGLTTANVSESNNNLYYTNARVLSNVLALLPTYTGNINAGNVIANSFVAAATGTGTLTATGDFNIVSGGNIRLTGNVYSNTLISTATGSGSITSTSDFNINAASNVNITAANINLNSNNIVATGNVIASRFFGNGASLTGISASAFSGNTNGITEGTINLYYTNTRVYSNVIALLPTLAGNNISIDANGRISANVSATVFATSIVGLTTANVTEVGSNLYFTNTRVVSALTAGEGITLAANGLISGGVHAITDSQTFAGGNANITLGTSVSLARRIIVTIDGLVQIPITDYTVSGTILTLIPTPSPNSTIEVKFFGNEAITTQTFNPFLLAGL